MANTLNLGNGDWATKENSLLGYNSESGNYKPLPFDFTRASNATFVNKSGLIETAANGVPRIDFLGNTKGALLLEPQRSNYWTNSEGSAITLNSPLGEFGFYTLNNTNISRTITYVGTITFTFIIKKIDGTIPTITTSGGSGDLVVLVSGSSSAGVSGVLTDIGNGFYKFELTREANGASVARIQNNSGLDTYVSLIQYEEGSYATSYIPTQGSAVTRVADACNNGGNEQVINSTEGVLYAEVANFANDSRICLNNGSTSNQISIRYDESLNKIECVLYNGSNQAIISHILSEVGLFNKLAFKYKLNDFALWINSVEVGTDTSGTTFTEGTLSELDFDAGNGVLPFYGKVKDVRVYNTALTDQELAALTTI
tara:strand:+ start:814 stop:1926 length:1113 start_codon:yes stop_codon:yes gene_type:complete